MKKLLIAIVLFASTTSFAGVNPTLAKEIRNKTIINLTKVQLDKKGRDFVSVKFKIIENEIHILNMNGSSSLLKERVKQRLESIQVSSNYEEGKKYIFRFLFKKEE